MQPLKASGIPATHNAYKRIKRNEKSIMIRLVKETWEPILKQSLDIPNNWIYNREVLVGRRM
jgi:hypothetical protein